MGGGQEIINRLAFEPLEIPMVTGGEESGTGLPEWEGAKP